LRLFVQAKGKKEDRRILLVALAELMREQYIALQTDMVEAFEELLQLLLDNSGTSQSRNQLSNSG